MLDFAPLVRVGQPESMYMTIAFLQVMAGEFWWNGFRPQQPFRGTHRRRAQRLADRRCVFDARKRSTVQRETGSRHPALWLPVELARPSDSSDSFQCVQRAAIAEGLCGRW